MRIYRFRMIFALSSKYSLVLMIYGHYINFRITIKIIQPIGAATGWCKSNLLIPAQLHKNSLADVLINKCYKFLPKILMHLIQYNLHIVQFQLSFVGINITEPETDKIICNEIQSFARFFRILFCYRRSLLYKAQI